MLYAYYGDLPTYNKKLDALVDYIHEHKDAMDARFVLAYHNLMMEHKDTAMTQIEEVVAKIPQDQLAVKLLKDLRGSIPATVKKSSTNAIVNPPSVIVIPKNGKEV